MVERYTATGPDYLWNEGRRARVGQPETITAFAADDDGEASTRRDAPSEQPPRQGGGGGGGLPNSAAGLRLAWFVYRGAGKVTFDPPQIAVWEDHRDGANSPWAVGFTTPPTPPGGKWEVRVTFSASGTYGLRGLASDGALLASEDVTFVVE